MKLLLIFFAFYSLNSFGVYGEDDRRDFYQIENPKIKELSKAVAYQVERHYELKGFKFLKNWTVVTKPLYRKNVCSEQAFAYQPAFRNNCTGVLVGPKTLLTAGNCITEHYCWNDLYYWMFDYNLTSEKSFNNKIPRKNFYTCKRIIKRVYNPKTAQSYALLELNKVVKGVTPVEINTEGDLGLNDELVTMGHINGLPLKIADDSQVKDINLKHFILNSDISGSSLGSPVFNANTYKLEAIMIYGTQHYKDSNRGCKVKNQFIHDDAKELAFKVGFLKEQF